VTKEELVGVVNRAYALWNQQVPVASQKEVYEAWWSMLWDIGLGDAMGALTVLSALDSYMPRPGGLRKRVIDSSGVEQPPSPFEAWNLLRSATDQINAGTFQPVVLHPAVRETIRQTGTNLHTNNDREQFIKLYEQNCIKWQQHLYNPGEPQ